MIRWLIAAILLLCASTAQADELRPASISFEQNNAAQWDLRWKQPLAGPGEARIVTPELPANCSISGEPVVRHAPMALLGQASVTCDGPVAGGRIGAPDLVLAGDALVRVAPLGRVVQAYRLTNNAPFATIAARPRASDVWRSYFSLGVEHILEGWDHLLFVIALVLLVVRGWAVIKAATAFTLAHSLTLAGATLGYAGMTQAPVEALIALSIVFLAVELARGSRETLTKRLPWLVAFAFGLLHGFGFAGALREIGMPEGEVPAALVSFNLGVEAGQLLVIAVVLAMRAAVKRLVPAAEERAVHLASYGIGITGAYWLIDRVVG